MPKYEEVLPALKWRRAHFRSPSAYALAESLSVDELPYPAIPGNIWPSVNAFRKLGGEPRLRAATRFLRDESLKLGQERSHKAKLLSLPSPQAFDAVAYNRSVLDILEAARELEDSTLHNPITYAEKLIPLCDAIQRWKKQLPETKK